MVLLGLIITALVLMVFLMLIVLEVPGIGRKLPVPSASHRAGPGSAWKPGR